MRKILTLFSLLCAVSVVESQNLFADNQTITNADRAFAQKLSQGNTAEVTLGKLAQQKSLQPQIKDFGKMMVEDHSKLEKDLMQWALKNEIPLKGSMSTADLSEQKRLASLSGENFDKEYVQMMVKDHKTDVAEVRNFSKTTQNPELKSLTEKAVPILEKHLQAIEKIQSQTGVNP